jgi:sec-independent protein translocase protein TatA
VSGCIRLIQPTQTHFYSLVSKQVGRIEAFAGIRDFKFGNITLRNRYEWIERRTTSLRNNQIEDFMLITIASIMNLMGPDMMVILLIVLLLFGAKKLPELARGMGQAVREFGAARDEVERNLCQSGPNGVAPSKLLDAKTALPPAR